MCDKNGSPALPGKLGKPDSSISANDNLPIVQRARILDWFFNKSNRISTLEARQILGIMSPACRIMELRDMGHDIFTDWESQTDVTGTKHRVGVYVYMGFPLTIQAEVVHHVTHKNG